MADQRDPKPTESMSDTPPRVSIGMPIFNGEAYLEPALNSLLAQTFADFEVIICDNASTDGTESICRAYAGRDERIRYFRNAENVGAARNFNRTFELSRGEYFKWFAHDDVIAPTYLQRCVEVLDSAPKSDVLCFPRRRYMTPDGRLINGEPHLTQSKRVVGKSLDRISFAKLVRVCNSRFPIFVFGLMRREAVAKTRLIGAFPASDLVFVAEMRLLGDLREAPEELFYQRLHPPTPDVLDRMTRAGDSAWFDPTTRGGLLIPEFRVLLEYVRAIRRTDLPGSAKWRYRLALLGYVVTRPRHWLSRLTKRLWRIPWRIWSFLSLGAVRASSFTTLPLRLWAMVSGLRGRDPSRLKSAVSLPGRQSREELLAFAVERLRQRNDARADRLLVQWLHGVSEIRRTAAARAIGPASERFAPVVLERLGHGANPEDQKRLLDLFAVTSGADHAAAWEEILNNGRPRTTESAATTETRSCGEGGCNGHTSRVRAHARVQR